MSFVNALIELERRTPDAPDTKASCNTRSYYCDGSWFVRHAFGQVLSRHLPEYRGTMAQMRFLRYDGKSQSSNTITAPHPNPNPNPNALLRTGIGQGLPPHVDLSRWGPPHPEGSECFSTHTFILYLTGNACEDDEAGGETVLLDGTLAGIRGGNEDEFRFIEQNESHLSHAANDSAAQDGKDETGDSTAGRSHTKEKLAVQGTLYAVAFLLLQKAVNPNPNPNPNPRPNPHPNPNLNPNL